MFRIGLLQLHIGAAGAGCEDKRDGGGDEFAVILPETDSADARTTASKLTEVISKRRDWGGGLLEEVALDVSAGVATSPQDGTSVNDLLFCADRALYTSKSRPMTGKAARVGISRRRRLV